MLLLQFINRHRNQYDAYNLLNDLSSEQRQEALLAALSLWSQTFPRTNVTAYARLIAGNPYAYLPIDFLYATYEQFYSVWANGSNILPGQIIPASINDFFNIGYGYFGASSSNPFTEIGSTSFSAAYDISFRESEIPVTISDRGLQAVDLGSNSNETTSKTIRYDALHQIVDEGKLLTVVSLPDNNDTLIVGSKTYTLKTIATLTDDIEIQADIYQMADTISDRIYRDIASTLTNPKSYLNAILLRPVLLGTNITLTPDGTRLTSNKLVALNTVPSSDYWKIFILMMYFIAQYKELQSLTQRNTDLAKSFNTLKIDYFNRIKPYLHVAR